MNAKTFQDFRRLFEKNLWQSLEWSNLQVALGKEVLFIGDDEAMGMGIIQKLPFGFSYLEFPRGPMGLTDTGFWNEVEQKAKQASCVFTRISPQYNLNQIPRFSFQSDIQVFPENTLILDLNLSEEELLKQMKPKGRYNIRIAQRSKVKVEESENVEAFYKLLQETTSRDGFSGHGAEYYKTFLKNVKGSQLLLASVFDEETEKDVVIAGGIFVFFEDTCTYYYGASTSHKSYRNLMAPYLLQWFAITEAQQQGLEKYDFLGIAPEDQKNHALEGVTRFKKQFGGIVVSAPVALDIVYRPFIYAVWRIWRFVRRII